MSGQTPTEIYRVDPGAKVTENPHVKTWNLQVNKKPKSLAAKKTGKEARDRRISFSGVKSI